MELKVMDMVQSQARFEVVAWNQIYRLLFNQVKCIQKSNFKPDAIVGISRGGLIPARIISDLLDNPNLVNIKIERYSGIEETKGEIKLTQCLNLDVHGKVILVVDEIADSGESLRMAKEHVLSCGACLVKTATIFIKENCAFQPDFYEKTADSWVVFPWEFTETTKSIYKKNRQSPARMQEELTKLSDAGVPKRFISFFVSQFSEGQNSC